MCLGFGGHISGIDKAVSMKMKGMMITLPGLGNCRRKSKQAIIFSHFGTAIVFKYFILRFQKLMWII